MISMISWNGVSGCYSPYSAVRSPRILSYEILANVTSGRLSSLFYHWSSSLLVLEDSSKRLGKSISRVFMRGCYFVRYFSVEILICLARVDFPIPGRPTGTKNSFYTPCIDSGVTRPTMNFKSDYCIYSGLHPKGTATTC